MLQDPDFFKIKICWLIKAGSLVSFIRNGCWAIYLWKQLPVFTKKVDNKTSMKCELCLLLKASILYSQGCSRVGRQDRGRSGRGRHEHWSHGSCSKFWNFVVHVRVIVQWIFIRFLSCIISLFWILRLVSKHNNFIMSMLG